MAAAVTDVSKELVVVSLAVSQAFFLIVAVPQKRLFTFGTNKMLNVPLLSQRIDHASFDRPATGPTDWDAHLVVAGQAIEFPFQLPGFSSQLLPAMGAVEVIWMVGVTPEHQRQLINYQVALLTDILAQPLGLLLIVALPAQMPASIFYEAQVS